MATADQVKALVRSHAEGDDTQFYSVAMQVAARAARGVQARFGQELRQLIDEVRRRTPRGQGKLIPVAQPRGELAGMLSASYPSTRMAGHGPRNAGPRATEPSHRRAATAGPALGTGVRPLSRLLLIGPPGTGKTMTAGHWRAS